MLPLQGMLVVALEQAVAAPYCTLRLADAGARVVKIERPEGETARHYDRAVKGTSAYFAWLNRGKESAVLDIKAEPDRAVLDRLIAKADIFVANLAPGSLARIGLAPAQLVERHPRLIAADRRLCADLVLSRHARLRSARAGGSRALLGDRHR